MKCPECKFEVPDDSNFCNHCGCQLAETLVADKSFTPAESERKQVTILFSDLSGYTAMTERLDPEDAKEIMSRIFGDIAKIVAKYEGFIERFVGDAVMAVFGVPKAHEDDPVRAIKASIDIHRSVEELNPRLKNIIEKPIAMHSGINTGLVITGEVNLDHGTHGLTGDAINTASRIQAISKKGEILIGYETYRQSVGFFDLEELKATNVKGKSDPLRIYRLISAKEEPLTVRRLSGRKADLIGRNSEISQLHEAFDDLKKGLGSIVSISGDAGTGKSRLFEDFKNNLYNENATVFEGHAFPYAQNTSYFPLIDFLNRALQIKESDAPNVIMEKIKVGVQDLIDESNQIEPLIGSLYSLSSPEIENISPELWKYHLQEAIKLILEGYAQKLPTIFFLEDLHWADAPFLELLRKALFEIHTPALVICTYRPPFRLFTSDQIHSFSGNYQDIRLEDLSESDAQDMVASLLKTDSLPTELSIFIKDKVDRNPFYLEEIITSMIESDGLVEDGGEWSLRKKVSELGISSTVQGVISARLDRLEKKEKRLLQEASVIGRVFLYDILKRLTEFRVEIDICLSILEQIDLIRIKSLHPDLVYAFKHALTQEAVYNGLTKRDRKAIHDQIGQIIEQLFYDKLPEFYEILAFHFKHGTSTGKAVKYLMKAAQKSFTRFAVAESHQYYEEAYKLLTNERVALQQRDDLLVDLLNEWGLVFLWGVRFQVS